MSIPSPSTVRSNYGISPECINPAGRRSRLELVTGCQNQMLGVLNNDYEYILRYMHYAPPSAPTTAYQLVHFTRHKPQAGLLA